MADDAVVSKTATLDTASQDGQPSQASGERIQGGTNGQPSENKGQAAQVDENIKNLQRKLSEKDLESKRALAEAQQARGLVQQLQQRLNHMEESAAPDDFARMELRLKRAEEQAAQYAQAYNQTLQQQQADSARANALKEIAEEFGVKPDDLREATDYMSAVKLAAKAQRDKETRKQQQDEQRAADNMPDVGGGAPRTNESAWEREWREAKERKDSLTMMRLARTQPKGAKK